MHALKTISEFCLFKAITAKKKKILIQDFKMSFATTRVALVYGLNREKRAKMVPPKKSCKTKNDLLKQLHNNRLFYFF